MTLMLTTQMWGILGIIIIIILIVVFIAFIVVSTFQNLLEIMLNYTQSVTNIDDNTELINHGDIKEMIIKVINDHREIADVCYDNPSEDDDLMVLYKSKNGMVAEEIIEKLNDI